jgi:hypothetical protein
MILSECPKCDGVLIISHGENGRAICALCRLAFILQDSKLREPNRAERIEMLSDPRFLALQTLLIEGGTSMNDMLNDIAASGRKGLDGKDIDPKQAILDQAEILIAISPNGIRVVAKEGYNLAELPWLLREIAGDLEQDVFRK